MAQSSTSQLYHEYTTTLFEVLGSLFTIVFYVPVATVESRNETYMAIDCIYLRV